MRMSEASYDVEILGHVVPAKINDGSYISTSSSVGIDWRAIKLNISNGHNKGTGTGVL